MLHVFRIFYNNIRVEKPDYTPEFRRSIEIWPKNTFGVSKVLDGKLHLPMHLTNQLVNYKSNRAIVISENILGEISSFESIPKNYTYFNIELLQIRFTESSMVELFVKNTYSPKYLETPRPFRFAHKISDLEPENPIRYRTNYKYESFGTRCSQRSYLEFDCVIEHLGSAEEIRFTTDKAQIVDLTHAKVIDERKILK
jgi:hypothetical protein